MTVKIKYSGHVLLEKDADNPGSVKSGSTDNTDYAPRKKRIYYDTESFKKKMSAIHPEIIVLGEFEGQNKPILCKCKKCGNTISPKPSNLLHGHGCIHCGRKKNKQHMASCPNGTSFAEQFIYEGLRSVIGENAVLNRDRERIGKELDIYIPSYNYAVEFGGWTWHKDKLEDDNEKARLCRSNGITLFVVYDNCPEKRVQLDAEHITFPYDLGSEKEYKTLKRLVLIITDLLKIPDVTKESVTDSIKWNEVIEKAKENSKRKSTEKFIKEVLNVNDAVTVLGEYYNTKEKILCKCNACGHQWPAAPSHLLNGHGCPICGRKKANKAMTKYTTDTFRTAVSEVNPHTSVIGEYISHKKKILCRCNICGNEWNASPCHLLNGHGCKRCASRKYDTESFREIIKKTRSDISVIGEYISWDKAVLCQCNTCGRKFGPNPRRILAGAKCPKCSRRPRYTKETFQKKLRDIGLNITLLGEYVNTETPISCKCDKCGYVWNPKPHSLIKNRRCPVCA